MVDTVIVNGRVVSGNGTRETGIAIKDGIIVALAEPEALPPAKRTVDAHGQHVLPGIVDPECHVGSHRPLKDSLDSETRAAAAGGVTTWGIMQSSSKLRKEYIDEPRPEDVVPYSEVMSEFIGVLESNAFIDCFLTGFITTDAQALDIPRVAQEYGRDLVQVLPPHDAGGEHLQRVARTGTGRASGLRRRYRVTWAWRRPPSLGLPASFAFIPRTTRSSDSSKNVSSEPDAPTWRPGTNGLRISARRVT